MKICRGVLREMLDGPDHVRDLEIVIIDDARQVIEAGAVGPLDDVVLLLVPVELAHAANVVVETCIARRAASCSRTTCVRPSAANFAACSSVSAIHLRL